MREMLAIQHDMIYKLHFKYWWILQRQILLRPVKSLPVSCKTERSGWATRRSRSQWCKTEQSGRASWRSRSRWCSKVDGQGNRMGAERKSQPNFEVWSREEWSLWIKNRKQEKVEKPINTRVSKKSRKNLYALMNQYPPYVSVGTLFYYHRTTDICKE